MRDPSVRECSLRLCADAASVEAGVFAVFVLFALCAFIVRLHYVMANARRSNVDATVGPRTRRFCKAHTRWHYHRGTDARGVMTAWPS
jgi:hypothetical protein